jgi:hypothetical protein
LSLRESDTCETGLACSEVRVRSWAMLVSSIRWYGQGASCVDIPMRWRCFCVISVREGSAATNIRAIDAHVSDSRWAHCVSMRRVLPLGLVAPGLFIIYFGEGLLDYVCSLQYAARLEAAGRRPSVAHFIVDRAHASIPIGTQMKTGTMLMTGMAGMAGVIRISAITPVSRAKRCCACMARSTKPARLENFIRPHVPTESAEDAL